MVVAMAVAVAVTVAVAMAMVVWRALGPRTFLRKLPCCGRRYRTQSGMASLRCYSHPYYYLRKGDRIVETITSESDVVSVVLSGGTIGDAPLDWKVHEDSRNEFFVKDSYWTGKS